jgi:hypothetical protein
MKPSLISCPSSFPVLYHVACTYPITLHEGLQTFCFFLCTQSNLRDGVIYNVYFHPHNTFYIINDLLRIVESLSFFEMGGWHQGMT